MYNFKKNTKILIIDRGWLEDQTLYEEQFLSFLKASFCNCEERIYPKLQITIKFQIISIMKEINDGKAYDFIDDKDKVKQMRIDHYKELDTEFPKYTERFSTDMIGHNNNKLNTLYVFLVYTESEREIEVLRKRYSVKAILKFKEEPKEYDDDIKRIYINSIPEALRVSKQMPLFLFQDIEEIKPFII